MADHFNPWVWAGFASHSLRPEEAEAVRLHVEAGCAPCGREQDFWRLLSGTLQLEREPLAEGCVERALALASPRNLANRARRQSAHDGVRLAFDSFTAPWPATVRGMQVRRHCVYDLAPAGSDRPAASVEVMVERVSRHDGWSIVGQVFDAASEGWHDCTVTLAPIAGGSTAQTPCQGRTNAFGEFAFVQPDAGPWRLEVHAGQRHWGVEPVLLP